MFVIQEACQKCKIPLYTKIAFDEALRWHSYTPSNQMTLGSDVIALIHVLLDRIEKYHGTMLVEHALGYVTAAKAGIRYKFLTLINPMGFSLSMNCQITQSVHCLSSSSEMEDVLSCDDVVLNDVYQYHTPPLRRLPPLLWVRIQSDLEGFLATSGDGGVQVIRWYHRQFKTVATEQYLRDESRRYLFYKMLGVRLSQLLLFTHLQIQF